MLRGTTSGDDDASPGARPGQREGGWIRAHQGRTHARRKRAGLTDQGVAVVPKGHTFRK